MKPVYEQGIHLTGTILWLDAYHPQDLCFISHAHVTSVVPHHKVLSTNATLRLYKKSVENAKNQVRGLVCTYNRPFSLGQLSIELFPAGHILGSAQIRVTLDNKSLVYSGGFSLQKKLTCEPIEIKSCDELILPAHYADPQFVFPPFEESYAHLEAEVKKALDQKRIPVVFASTIGTAQEVIKLLSDAGYSIRAHRSIYEKNKIYLELGADIKNCKRFRGTPRPDEVIVWPPHLRSSPAIKSLKRARTILLHGRTVLPGFHQRHKMDVGIPISDSADFNETLSYIEQTSPKKVYLVHGYAQTFAETLRGRGIEAEALTQQQIDLSL